MLPTPFEPSVEDLRRLSSNEAVDLIRDILNAAAGAIGIPIHLVSVPTSITVPDGGVDAEIDSNNVDLGKHDVMFPGHSYYQIKTGAFSGSRDSELRALLLKPSARTKKKKNNPKGEKKGSKTKEAAVPQFNDRILECLKNNGTLVVAIFGSDSPKPTSKQIEKSLKDLIKKIDPAFSRARVRVWRPNQIGKMCSIAPAAGLRVRGIRAPGNVHGLDWMGRSSGFEGEFLADKPQQAAIDKIREAVASPAFVHVRIVGDPGIGKTRLVFEALNEPRFGSRTLYFQGADEILTGDLLGQLEWVAKNHPIVVVVDECDPEARLVIHRILRKNESPISLVTIYSDLDDQDARSPEYIFVDPPQLSDKQLEQIFSSYGVPKDRAAWLAPLCSGSPRVAHAVGASIRTSENVEELLRPRTLNNIWDHYISGREGKKSPDYLDRHVVLSCVALFRRFGWSGASETEARAIYETLVKPVADMSWARFHQVVEQLRARKILQGQTTLYLSPRLLHVKLWCDWWEQYGGGMQIETIIAGLPEELLEWLFEMFVYARESEVANRLVERLLASGGLFADLEAYGEKKAGRLFFALAQVNPEAAVRVVNEALENRSANELVKFTDGRRQIVHAMEHAALYGHSFKGAALALLRLAEAENETWSNNATGVFSDLFTLGYGRVASTELSPEDRLPILLDVLKDSSPARRSLALKAFESALKTQFSRMSLGEAHGLRDLPKGWMPKTYGELHEAYKTYIEALWRVRTELRPDERVQAERTLTGHARSFLRIPSIQDVMINCLGEIAGQDDAGRLRVVETIVEVLHYDRKDLKDSIVSQLQELYQRLVEGSFRDRLRRHVALQLVEDKFDDKGQHLDGPTAEFLAIVDDSLSTRDQLTRELHWLVTNEAQNGYTFGYELGKRDPNTALWPKILAAFVDAGSDRSDFFIGGYLAGVFTESPSSWEMCIEEVLRSPAKEQTTYVVWRSGMTPRIAAALLAAVRSGSIETETLQAFAYGSASKRIPEDALRQMLELLLNKGTYRAVVGALELWDYGARRSEYTDPWKWDLCKRILSHAAFFTKRKDTTRNTMVDYHWKEAAIALIKAQPKSSIDLVELCLDHFGESGTVVDGFRPQTLEFLNEAVKHAPKEMWKLISTRIGPPEGGNAYRVLSWLRGELGFGSEREPGAFALIPWDLVAGWIEEDIESRAAYIARHIPMGVPRRSSPRSFSRTILERYGKRTDVRRALHANFHTEGWSGSASTHYRNKLRAIQDAIKDESDSSVMTWLKEEEDSLVDMIKREEAREERERF